METLPMMNDGASFWGSSANNVFALYSKFKPTPVEREYFNQSDFAKLLGVSVMTLWRFEHGYVTKTGKHIPPVEGFPQALNLGGRRLWRKADIDLFMAGLKAA